MIHVDWYYDRYLPARDRGRLEWARLRGLSAIPPTLYTSVIECSPAVAKIAEKVWGSASSGHFSHAPETRLVVNEGMRDDRIAFEFDIKEEQS